MKVFARQISNLTDARYFAAMGVDFLGFNLSPSHTDSVSHEFIRQVRDWVSGPEIIGCFTGFEEEDFIRDCIQKIQLSGLSFEPFAENRIVKSFKPLIIFRETRVELLQDLPMENDGFIIIHFGNLDETDEILSWIQGQKIKSEKVFLDGPMEHEFFTPKILQQIGGISVRGSAEEKTGIKSFDQLDTLFDRIGSIEL